jgi:type II secretory pathway component PulF
MAESARHTHALLQHLVRMQLAGLSWIDALQIWRDTCPTQQRPRVDQIMQRLRRGQNLSDALCRGGWLKGAPLALSRSAESGGIWAIQMQAWLQHNEQHAQLMRQIRSALAYPALVLLLTLIVVCGVLIGVLPVFAGLYEQMHASLPWATLALLHTREALVQWGGVGLGAVVLMAGGAGLSWRHEQARWWLERLCWLTPIGGRWRQMHIESKWCALMSNLIEAGQDWSSALEWAGVAVGSPVMARASERIQGRLVSGQPLSWAMANCRVSVHRAWQRPLFSPMLTQWAKAAEASGTLPQVLQQWSRIQAELLSTEWAMACRMLEPVLMGLMGLLMAWLVLALYLPVLQMGQIM